MPDQYYLSRRMAVDTFKMSSQQISSQKRLLLLLGCVSVLLVVSTSCLNGVDAFQAVANKMPRQQRSRFSPLFVAEGKQQRSSSGSSSSGSGDDYSPLFYSEKAKSSSHKNNHNDTSTTALFSDQADASSATFGDVVRPKYLSGDDKGASGAAANAPLFSSSSSSLPQSQTTSTASSATDSIDEVEAAARLKRRNLIVAIASVAVACLNYFWQFTHPISPVQLLVGMQETSAPLSVIGENGKPTVVDFWAPWCENCKLMAPTLRQVEDEYKDKVNFVLVNGDKRESWPLIEAFGVDGIPHMALVTADGNVETALIGPIPKRVLEADLDVLISNAKRQGNAEPEAVPYRMLDVFASNPEARKVHFDP